VVSLAMADAADDAIGRPSGTVRLKWPNDLVVAHDGGIRKLAGVLGETDGLGSAEPRAVVGIGVNVDWSADDYPAELAGSMTSLREVAGRPVDRESLLDGFVGRLEPAVGGLRDGRFEAASWIDRQVTTGRDVELVDPDGGRSTVRAIGVDPDTGALLVDDPGATRGTRSVMVGEVRHVRPATRAGARV
jgi:BirA family biotin operon repressor/biotin-[acetyl-CoA-carboxylase] ligase